MPITISVNSPNDECTYSDPNSDSGISASSDRIADLTPLNFNLSEIDELDDMLALSQQTDNFTDNIKEKAAEKVELIEKETSIVCSKTDETEQITFDEITDSTPFSEINSQPEVVSTEPVALSEIKFQTEVVSEEPVALKTQLKITIARPKIKPTYNESYHESDTLIADETLNFDLQIPSDEVDQVQSMDQEVEEPKADILKVIFFVLADYKLKKVKWL